MIEFDNIVGNFLEISSFFVKPGKKYKIIFRSEVEKEEFIDLTAGIKPPKKGKVLLFGKDIFYADKDEYYNTIKKMGLVWQDGGVISNLKVWENIVLPVWYHKGMKPATVEKKVIEFYKNFNMDSNSLSHYMGMLPATLKTLDRRLICLIRSILMEPELIIYDDIFAGIKTEISGKLKEVTENFHKEKQNRTSIYLTITEESIKDIKADYSIIPEAEGFKICH